MASSGPDRITDRAGQGSAQPASAAWLQALAVTAALLVAARLLFGVGTLPGWDEKYVKPVLDAIFASGWSMGAILDYDDTKGPVFFWLYAAFGELFGESISNLRWLSVIATALWTSMLVGILAPSERRASRWLVVVFLALTSAAAR